MYTLIPPLYTYLLKQCIKEFKDFYAKYGLDEEPSIALFIKGLCK